MFEMIYTYSRCRKIIHAREGKRNGDISIKKPTDSRETERTILLSPSATKDYSELGLSP